MPLTKQIARPTAVFKDDIEEINFIGEKFYTSEKLRVEVSKTLIKHLNNNTAKKLLILIKNNVMVPVFSTTNSLQLIKRILTKTNGVYDVIGKLRGVYIKSANKIFIMADSELTLIGKASESWVARTCVHEAVHYIATNKMKKFLSINSKPLYNFYDYYFYQYLQTDKVPKENINLIINMISRIDNTPHPSTSLLKKYSDLLFKLQPYSELDDNEFVKRVKTFMVFVHLSMQIGDKAATEKFWDVLNPLWWTYEDIFKLKEKKVKSYHYQELTIISEVISILAGTKPKSDIANKTINLL